MLDKFMISCYHNIKIVRMVIKIKQIIIRLSDKIHQQLKIKTIKENTSIQSLIENFIKQYVDEEKDN